MFGNFLAKFVDLARNAFTLRHNVGELGFGGVYLIGRLPQLLVHDANSLIVSDSPVSDTAPLMAVKTLLQDIILIPCS